MEWPSVEKNVCITAFLHFSKAFLRLVDKMGNYDIVRVKNEKKFPWPKSRSSVSLQKTITNQISRRVWKRDILYLTFLISIAIIALNH